MYKPHCCAPGIILPPNRSLAGDGGLVMGRSSSKLGGLTMPAGQACKLRLDYRVLVMDHCLFSFWQSVFDLVAAADAADVRGSNVAGAEMAKMAS